MLDDDDFFTEFHSPPRRHRSFPGMGMVFAIWLASFALGLSVLGFLGWAIVKTMQHFGVV